MTFTTPAVHCSDIFYIMQRRKEATDVGKRSLELSTPLSDPTSQLRVSSCAKVAFYSTRPIVVACIWLPNMEEVDKSVIFVIDSGILECTFMRTVSCREYSSICSQIFLAYFCQSCKYIPNNVQVHSKSTYNT